MRRGHNTHEHQIRCRYCDPAKRRERRPLRQMRNRVMPEDVELDTDLASGKVQQRRSSARHSSAAAYDPAPAVRAERARYGNLTVEEQGVLTTDESPRVRIALARNSNLAPHAREALVTDEHPRVRSAARGRWRIPARQMATARSALRRRVLTLAENAADTVLDGSEAVATRTGSSASQ